MDLEMARRGRACMCVGLGPSRSYIFPRSLCMVWHWASTKEFMFLSLWLLLGKLGFVPSVLQRSSLMLS